MTDLHVTASGPAEGPLVVLVHGTMDRSASFAHLTRRLRDLRCVRYDRRGYGRSRAAGPGTIHDHADDLEAVLDGRPAVVVGHSFGGAVALVVAARRPDLVRGLLVYEAALSWLEWWPGNSAGATALAADAGDPGDAAEAFLRRMIGGRWDELPARTRADRRAEGPALLLELRSLREGPPCELSSVVAPTIVVRGSRSPAHLRDGAAHLAEALPNAELFECDGAGHGGHQSHSEVLAGLVRRLV